MANPAVQFITLDKFKLRVTEKLGQGSFATVYKAVNQGRHDAPEVVAVKCMSKKSFNKVTVERLLTEITLMKEELKHPHIVQMVDFLWDDQMVYIIMEYCSGGDLFSLIQKYRMLNEDTARKFLQQLASALKFLREKNVVHMDLKPQNILLSSEHNPCLKLADFGMAQNLNTGDHADSFRGSPLYMAPEIFLADHYDAKVDLWSVGVILYETLFGHAPYSSRTTDELIVKIRQDVPIIIPQRPPVSCSCRDLLNGLLQREPDKRMSFDKFFTHPFIDLEHMPSAENLSKAVSLVKSAIIKDSEGRYVAAINLYCESLEYFIPIVKNEYDASKREELRRKVQQYMSRAEQLKGILKQKAQQKAQQKPEKLLEEMAVESQPIRAAMQLAYEAKLCDLQQDFNKALKLYEASIEKLFPLVEEEKDASRKKAITSEINLFLARAEELKTLIRELPAEQNPESSLPFKCRPM
ncbi:serine/threonine-protein kinase ULK3-like isoform X2 [Dysidea avara]|uniref:serine/threonine-protein kinase ULK3-like isoform X2 n=1 Tax=Dysidea avara TaxID=196820 RepID=UPI00331D4B9E